MKTLKTSLSSIAKISLLCLPLLLAPLQLHAKDISFTWTANPDPLTGYKLYYKVGTNSTQPFVGTGLNEGNSPITKGKISTCTVTGLSPDETYHFYITAYNDDGESEPSAILSIQPSSFPSPTITTMSIN